MRPTLPRLTPPPPRPAAAEVAPWSYPPESDGWYRAHACLEKMMARWGEALDALDGQLAGGVALERAQVKALNAHWSCFRDFLHQRERGTGDRSANA